MFKSRFKNYGLWVSMFSLLVLVCEGYGFNILPPNYQEIIACLLSILVCAGIVSNPTTETQWFLDDKK